MINIPGYEIRENLYLSNNSRVFRAIRISDSLPVVLKILNEEFPSPEKIARFRREYEIALTFNPGIDSKTSTPGVIAVYDWVRFEHTYMIVMEDFAAITLNQYLQIEGIQSGKTLPHLSIEKFLILAIQISEALSQIHRANIIHKDLNPSNIVINADLKMLKIIDFGISTVLPHENAPFNSSEMVEGTLAYISPEQTGRMNRAIDYRTDFYSLGVTFYQLISSQLPFESNDALEVLHWHIAKQPLSPEKIRPDIPEPLILIILKLLSKDVEDRYQSIHSLISDLQHCLDQWKLKKSIDSFKIASLDKSERFEIPQKIYGREKEIDILLNAAQRCSQGKCEIMLVSGNPGIGKTVLVQELYKPVTRQKGNFISGKYDLLQRDVPYTGLIQACRSLIHLILTQSDPQIDTIREKIQNILGQNGQVMVELIPEIEILIGKQPELTILPPIEAQTRLVKLFTLFIQSFTSADHPLVIFLDDLQWADAASLNLINQLMRAPASHHLFIIGAFRTDEVSLTHPITQMVDQIKKIGINVYQITIGPLPLPNITQWIADILQCNLINATGIAEIVYLKTGGNPFFIIECFKILYSYQVIKYNSKNHTWKWNLSEIKKQLISADVVEMMAGQMFKFSERTRRVMTLAACIGNVFNLRTLALVYGHSMRETALDLWPGLEKGLILPMSENYSLATLEVEGLVETTIFNYKFAHDQVQQAAYSLISDSEKQTIHLQIGNLLLKDIPVKSRQENIFTIVSHLNRGMDQIQDQNSRDKLAELNLAAGKRAKSSAAYQAAYSYFQTGINLLCKDGWRQKYDLCLALHDEAILSAFLCDDYERMEQIFNEILAESKTTVDMLKAYDVKILAYISQFKIIEGLDIGKRVLNKLGYKFPDKPKKLDVAFGYIKIKMMLLGKNIELLEKLPVMTDNLTLTIMRFFSNMATAAYSAEPNLMALIVFRSIEISLKFGISPEAGYAFIAYGLILCNLGDIDTGYRIGKMAVSLMENSIINVKPGAMVLYNYLIRHWKEPIRNTLPGLNLAYQTALDNGEFTFGALGIAQYCAYSYFAGKELKNLEKEIASLKGVVKQIKEEKNLYMVELYHQVILNLIDYSNSPILLSGPSYDEEKIRPLLEQAGSRYSLSYLYLNKFILCILFQDYPQALIYETQAESYLDGAAGTVNVTLFYFYDTLLCLALYRKSPATGKNSLLRKIKTNMKKIKAWEIRNPENNRHKYLLLEAEKASVLGRNQEARDLYDHSINLANKNGFIQEEALAYELAGLFYLGREQIDLANYYLRNAIFTYLAWGAEAKARDLQDHFPQFQVRSTDKNQDITSSMMIKRPIEEQSISGIDLASVLKTTQILMSEIVLNRLLEKVITTLMENAGAQRAFLILEKEGNLFIEAECEVEGILKVLQTEPLAHAEDRISLSIVGYAGRINKTVVLKAAAEEGLFINDPYVQKYQPKSILCLPILRRGISLGVLYLENNMVPDVFTPAKVELLTILAAQAAISLENAQYYAIMEQTVKKRTRALETLFEIASITSSSINAPVIFNRLLQKILETFECQAAFLNLITDRNSPQTISVVSEHWKKNKKDYDQFFLQNTIWQNVITQAKILNRTINSLDGEKLVYIGAPVHSSGRVLGVLSVIYYYDQCFSVEEIALFGSIADHFGRVIENDTLHKLSQKNAVIEERQRLARDIHDAVSQSVYSLSLFANSGEEASEKGQYDQARIYFKKIQEISQQALREMRLLIYELHPSILEQEGFIGALRQRLEAVEKRAGLQVELQVNLNSEIHSNLELELFRFAQEALNNVIKHSNASQLSIKVGQDNGSTKVEIIDNGKGFDPDLSIKQGGYGLRNMQERINRLGGFLEIKSEINVGTSISACVPSNSIQLLERTF